MNFQTQFKYFKRASARWGLFSAQWLIRKTPYVFVRGVMHVFLFMWYRFAIKLKRISRESLQIAFGEQKTASERHKIIRQCFENVGMSMMDLIYYSQFPSLVHEKFTIHGRHYLDQALAQNKGVIIITAHFGNFCLMMMELAQLGYKTNCIIRKPRDPAVAEAIYENMTRVGVKPIYSIPAPRSVQQSLKALRQNEILFVLLDQNFGSSGGVYVNFFGRQAATATGPIVMANRTGAPILMVFTIRDKDRYRIIIDPPFDIERKDNEEEMVHSNVQKITNIIEKYIRLYPTEWGWMHRRWKSQSVKKGKSHG